MSRMFGLPGGEILAFVEAARAAGIRFVLARHEAHAAFMADATGQLTGIPGVCVSTLGPGAVNMTLGVANAFLDHSPVIAITAAHSRGAGPYATHQHLDLNAIYRPFTKATITLDGCDTEAKVRYLARLSTAPRQAPVHIAVPSDVAGGEEGSSDGWSAPEIPLPPVRPSQEALDRVHAEIGASRRPVAIVGFDAQPEHATAVRAFIDAFGAPVFVTPKAKGLVPEDHPLFCGVCAGVSADAEVLDFFGRADLLVGVGFDPVESDKLWHQEMRLVALGPVSIAADQYRPYLECVGPLPDILAELRGRGLGPLDWAAGDLVAVRSAIEGALRPAARPRGLSGFELTCCLRDLFPRETIFLTDVGSVKMVTTQAWRCWEPGTFLESNGLSAMSYSLPAAIAARLARPDRPVLCTVGDGGLAMTLGEIETCVREQLDVTIVVYNDNSLSLIDVAQQRRGYPTTGVRFAPIDFAGAAKALGAWARRVETLDEVRAAIHAAPLHGPVVLDALVDPAEYVRQTAGHQRASR